MPDDKSMAYKRKGEKSPAEIIRDYPGAQFIENGWALSTSPLGYPEVTAPGKIVQGKYAVQGQTYGSGGDAAINSRALGLPDGISSELSNYYSGSPTVVYSSGAGDVDRNHERIHVGNRLSGGIKSDPGSVLDLIRSSVSSRLPSGVDPAREGPAYSFEDPSHYNKDEFAKYMDKVHVSSPRPVFQEASMPEDEMRDYLTTHPVPYNKKPPIAVKEIK